MTRTPARTVRRAAPALAVLLRAAHTGTWRVALMLVDDADAPLPILRRASNTFRVVGDRAP